MPSFTFPDPAPAIFLTTRPDLGDIAKGRLITINNYYEIFNGILNPKQIEGLRLLLTQFPQQQFNATEDRRTDRPDGDVHAPIVIMIENARNGFVWEVIKKNAHVIRGLKRAGFTGGWLGTSK